ncbi:hypothetical protein FAIPA1_240003 [Frankia sp. AiPs1]|uniref:hypothetical protein n=1 Tax=Frankia sp. AiPa1 TaxID=573492 RepID=UPI00202B9C03|nr:hypothetical protein [Frankia sp. AiPa1]MCL9762397.1 hypothetical protein [Frankia sp. AiPa1]
MTLGLSVFLVAVGATLRYALTWHPAGIDLQVLGLILMVAGIATCVICVLRAVLRAPVGEGPLLSTVPLLDRQAREHRDGALGEEPRATIPSPLPHPYRVRGPSPLCELPAPTEPTAPSSGAGATGADTDAVDLDAVTVVAAAADIPATPATVAGAGLTDSGCTDTGCTDDGYTDGGFADTAFVDTAFVDARFTDAGFADTALCEDELADDERPTQPGAAGPVWPSSRHRQPS